MKLDDLKKLVADIFEKAETKELIQSGAKIQSMIDEVATEQEALIKENKDLLKDYKDVVLHTAVKPDSSVASGTPAGSPTTMEEMLENWTSTHNSDGSKK